MAATPMRLGVDDAAWRSYRTLRSLTARTIPTLTSTLASADSSVAAGAHWVCITGVSGTNTVNAVAVTNGNSVILGTRMANEQLPAIPFTTTGTIRIDKLT